MANQQEAIAGALTAAQRYGAVQKAAIDAATALHQSSVNQAGTGLIGQPGGINENASKPT